MIVAHVYPRPPASFLRVARCVAALESTGRRDRIAWNVHGNGYALAYQFTLRSWRAVGGSTASWYAASATPAEQDYRAWRLYLLQGWGAWPNTSPRCVGR